MAVGSLGIIAITAGTPARITSNQSDPTARFRAKSIRIQADPNNTGVVYVGLAGMEGSPIGPQLLGYIPKPVSALTGPFESFEVTLPDVPAGLNAADIYVDGTSGDHVVVSYTAN